VLDVDPSPLVPLAELVLVLVLVPVLAPPAVLELVCDVWRSPKRFCVPRIAPRLDVPLAPTAWPLNAVLVLVAGVPWLVVAEDADDEAVLELAVADVGELVLLETSDLPAPYVPDALRLPRNWGAISAANRSAPTIPLRRIVRLRSPVRIVAVRSDAFSALAVSSLILDLASHARPPTAANATTTISHRLTLAGFLGAGCTTSGDCAAAPDRGAVLRTEARLM
jgi:hypothetical protein